MEEMIKHRSRENNPILSIHDPYKYIDFIRDEFSRREELIEKLRQEIRELREEAYKDIELQSLKKQIEEMQRERYLGFPISGEESDAIIEWKNKHDREDHRYLTAEQKLEAEGVSGGRYSYRFTPTSIGTFGTVRCSCGAEFEFRTV